VARILLGDSDREFLVSVLCQHHPAGRFDIDDLRRRAQIVYAAAYRDQAQQALDGLPPIAGAGPRSSERPGGSAGEDGSAAVTPRRARRKPAGCGRNERFRDPSSRVIMRVWVGPADASRHYAPDDAADA
jgi:hypothetical protein